ncbi:MAG: hypothetical protein Q7U04_02305 [Bacteriovorax sp.]|nr:hypothetical protein [Bacteriovorax sp.]
MKTTLLALLLTLNSVMASDQSVTSLSKVDLKCFVQVGKFDSMASNKQTIVGSDETNISFSTKDILFSSLYNSIREENSVTVFETNKKSFIKASNLVNHSIGTSSYRSRIVVDTPTGTCLRTEGCNSTILRSTERYAISNLDYENTWIEYKKYFISDVSGWIYSDENSISWALGERLNALVTFKFSPGDIKSILKNIGDQKVPLFSKIEGNSSFQLMVEANNENENNRPKLSKEVSERIEKYSNGSAQNTFIVGENRYSITLSCSPESITKAEVQL